MTAKPTRPPGAALGDAKIYLVLAATSILTRLPFLGRFVLVSFDGTYYLTQAKSLLAGTKMVGAFPIGYPLLVALFHLFIEDIVLAARLVSMVAGAGSAIVLFILARRIVRREYAFLCAMLFAVNPLFIRLSLMTMSESLYIFWVLLSMVLFQRKRYALFGLAMGLAAITRPEAIAIAGLLMLTKIREPKRIIAMAAGILIVYSVNVAVLSRAQGRLVIVPKTEFMGTSARIWQLRERTFDFEEGKAVREKVEALVPDRNIVVSYFERLPEALILSLRHLLPVLLFLSILGLWRKRSAIILAPLAPIVIYQLFTPRSDDRYILPYLPFLILGAMIGLDSLRGKNARSIGLALVVLSAVALPFVNSRTLLLPDDAALIGAREIGTLLRGDVTPADKIADRKPYVAFYAGSEYVEIPLAPYENTIRYLCDTGVRYLSLHTQVVRYFRPALAPLLFDRAVILGETRFIQVCYRTSGELVYERVTVADSPTWERIAGEGINDFAPCWSPDGRWVAFRSLDSEGGGGIYVAPPGAGAAKKIIDEHTLDDQLAWSPDGKSIAFASSALGNTDIFIVEVATGKVLQLTSSDGEDRSPSWSSDGRWIAFGSDRTGQNEIWLKQFATGAEAQLTTDGGNTYPAISPDGGRVAWIKEGEGIVIYDRRTGESLRPSVPSAVAFAPAWHPSGKYLAVTAQDWGSWDIYLLDSAGTDALLVTKDLKRQGMPAWRPDGGALAITSEHDGESSIWVLGGLEPYFDRLKDPPEIHTFKK